MKNNKLKNLMWEKQKEALRDPIEIVGNKYDSLGLSEKSLAYSATDTFLSILEKLNITLFITREYEHLLLALSVKKGKLLQSFVTLPHPTGITVDRGKNKLYVAATRSPNQIIEFGVMNGLNTRSDFKIGNEDVSYLIPTRTKYFPGMYYFHDIAMVGDSLYATSVGQNAVVKVDLTHNKPDSPQWWPKCIEENKVPNFTANFIQLNSIGAGESISDSFFSASSKKISKRRPGHLNYPTNKEGVIFSGKTREVYGDGLTRPHSVRLYNNKVWVDNSGYGEVGYIDDGKFTPIVKINGWTRGLCIIEDFLFVGSSMIIPKYFHYAPGLNLENQTCGIYVIDLKKGKIIGKILWPYGNQVFSIEWINAKITQGFTFENFKETTGKVKKIFYNYKL